MTRVVLMSAVKNLVGRVVREVLPGFPGVVLFRVILPLDEVIESVIDRVDLGVQDKFDGVFFLVFDFDSRWRILGLTGVSWADGF